jgi:hypothetical protein
LEFFDVRAESVLADGRRIGVTSLVDDGDRALIQFGLRNWPDDESSHRLEWTLRSVINGTPRYADRRGGGFGGGCRPSGTCAFDGGWWFGSVPASGDVTITCELDGTQLLVARVGQGDKMTAAGSIGILDGRHDPAPQHRQVVNALEAAGWRRERAVADESIAVRGQLSRVGDVEVRVVGLERWGRTLRAMVEMRGAEGIDELPRWWSIDLAHEREAPALGESFQSSVHGLIGHLALVDPSPSEPLTHYCADESLQ